MPREPDRSVSARPSLSEELLSASGRSARERALTSLFLVVCAAIAHTISFPAYAVRTRQMQFAYLHAPPAEQVLAAQPVATGTTCGLYSNLACYECSNRFVCVPWTILYPLQLSALLRGSLGVGGCSHLVLSEASERIIELAHFCELCQLIRADIQRRLLPIRPEVGGCVRHPDPGRDCGSLVPSRSFWQDETSACELAILSLKERPPTTVLTSENGPFLI